MQQNCLKSSLIVLIILLSHATFAIGTPSPETEMRQQQKDFTVFKKGIFLIEAKIDRHVAMDSIQRVFAATELEFSTKVLSPTEEYKLYAKCINLVQSGHTQVSPTRAVIRDYVVLGKSLPFDMVVVNKHVYVNGYAGDAKKKPKGSAKRNKSQEIPKGAEIIAIDEMTIPEWMEKIGEFISSDEDDPAFEYVIAGQAFDFFRFLATEEHKNYLEVDYVVKNDTIRESVRLGYAPLKLMEERFKADEKQFDKDKKSFGKFKFIGNVGYFRFPSFNDNHGKLYSEFLKKSFKKIRKKKGVETIIIDVRGNHGGNIQTELLSYFVSEPQVVGNYNIEKRLKRKERRHIKKNTEEFRRYKHNMREFKRFERKHPQFNGQVVTYPIDTALIFRGNVIVLTDEGTFSAASLLASQMKTLCNAQIMGSRAGGSYYACNAGTLKFTLPHSKITFILNPNVCASTLSTTSIDPDIKNVDVEIVPEYNAKPSVYKKNWEGVIKTAIKQGRKPARTAGI
jgi:hypothetical protein